MLTTVLGWDLFEWGRELLVSSSSSGNNDSQTMGYVPTLLALLSPGTQCGLMSRKKGDSPFAFFFVYTCWELGQVTKPLWVSLDSSSFNKTFYTLTHTYVHTLLTYFYVMLLAN